MVGSDGFDTILSNLPENQGELNTRSVTRSNTQMNNKPGTNYRSGTPKASYIDTGQLLSPRDIEKEQKSFIKLPHSRNISRHEESDLAPVPKNEILKVQV